jgi:hypothetical protein
MNEPISLAHALRRAALDLNAADPPPHTLAAAQAFLRAGSTALTRPSAAAVVHGNPSAADALRPQRPLRPEPVPRGWRRHTWAGAGAAALALVLVASVVLLVRPSPTAQPGPGADESLFVNLVPPDRWPPDASAAWLVRTELTGDRLAVLGLPFDPARAGQPVRADVLMRATGEVLAVRFVP